MYWLTAVWLGKLIILATRLIGGAGSALPGLLVERIYPGFINKAAHQLNKGSVVVSGTNGKTTTTKLLAGILEADNYRLVTNRAGSNMSRGIASAFLEHMDWKGQIAADTGLFEVDEAFMGDVCAKLKPRVAVVLNLLRDQLDRYGELDRTAELIAAGVRHARLAVLNIDDPLVMMLAKEGARRRVLYFGAVANISRRLPSDEQLHAQLPPSGRRKFKADLELTRLRSLGGSSQQLSLLFGQSKFNTSLLLPGVYNAYNATAALLAAQAMGVPLELATTSIKNVRPAYGRAELIQIADKQLQLLLVKNPAGFNQIIQNFLLSQPKAEIMMVVNDNFADGRDVSWLWDVQFEALAGLKRPVLTAGTRSYDLALRLKYAGVKTDAQSDINKAIQQFLNRLKPGQTGYIVPTYTAMTTIRKLMAKQAKLDEVWQ